jgi:hypothetical protein
MGKRLDSHWSKILDAQESSGQSVGRYSEENGYGKGTLQYWRAKLGRTRRGRTRSKPGTFLEVVVAAPPPDVAKPVLVVTLGHGGAQITFDSDTDLILARRVLVALC